MSDNNPQAVVEGQGQDQQTSEQHDEQQRSLQHPHLPPNLVGVSDEAGANPMLQASMEAAVAADQDQPSQEGVAEHEKQEEEQQQQVAVEQGDQQAPQQHAEDSVGQEFTQTDQENQTAANFFDQNYQAYEFPTSSGALNAANGGNVATSFPFHPHPQHPHLGVEALGHAAAASQHAGRVSVPGVSAPEGEGGNHVFSSANGADHSMDLTMTSVGDTTNASDVPDAQQDRSSGKAARSSLSVPGTDGSGSKKETPYSRSPDMRNSHKLAERKRRKEMKDLFDDLRDQLPVDRGPKTSKWEILCKAVEHITALQKERDSFAAELNALRGGEQVMTTEEGVAPPAPAPEENVGADEYAKYEEQQVASQQQVEAAAAAANQFTAHHDYTQPGQEEQQQDQQDQGQQQHHLHHDVGQEAEYKPEDQSAHEAVHEQAPTEQDWGAIAAQAAHAQAAHAQSAQ